MRKFLIPLLMVSAAVPTVANAQWRDKRGDDTERSESRKSNNDRGDRPQRAERPQQVERQQIERPRFERPEPVQVQRPQIERVERVRVDQRRESGDLRFDRSFDDSNRIQDQRRQRQIEAVRQQMQQRTLDARRNDSRSAPVAGTAPRGGWDGYRDRVIREGQVVPQNRDGNWQNRDGDRRWGDRNGGTWSNRTPGQWANRDGSWSNRWRTNNRYDWHRYRDRNRSIFRIGIYFDPYGYNYRRYNVGYNMWPSYYQSNYWIDDPWMYRLPEVWGPYRWVRYYNDALLVNIYTGQVEDVLYNFFW